MAQTNDYKAQAAAPSVKQQQDLFNQQQEFANQMKQQAAGQGPSLANELLKNSVQQQTSQANALAASQQGNINAGLATRNAQQMAGQAGQAAAAQGAQMRQGEQMQAQQMLGGQLNTMSGQGQQAQQFKDQLDAGIKSENVKAANDMFGNVFGGIMKGASAIGSAVASDERVKKDIKPGEHDIKSFLDNLSAHSYEYKNPSQPGASPGEHTGVMAQELEKSKVGSQMVMDTPNGKMVDYAKGLPAILAAQAELNKRLDKIEGKKKMAMGGEVAGLQGEEDGQDLLSKGIMAGMSGFGEGMSQGAQQSSGGKANPFDAVGDAAGLVAGAFIPKQPTVTPQGPTAPIYQETVTQMPKGSSFAAQTLQKLAQGGMAKPALTTPQIIMQHGAMVPGQAKVKGDNQKNDIVDAKLSPGEIVIPRTVVNSKDAPEAAKRFVEAILAKKGKK